MMAGPLGIAVAIVLAVSVISGADAAPSFKPQCADPFSAARSPANPLGLAVTPPASNPLAGANFFVDGPAHGAAAGAIARLLGIDKSTPVGKPLPSFSDSESWAEFSNYVAAHLSAVDAATRHKILMLEKVASEPETQRVSRFSQGGTPVGVYSQTQKLFCHNFTADPGTIPVIITYFLHATLGGCPTRRDMNAYRPTFQAQISAIAKATGNRPAVFLLELDAVGSSACIAHGGVLPVWESLLRFESTTLGRLPHAVVYMAGGYSDANTPAYAAKILNAGGIRNIEGFFTNGTHNNWTSKEIAYGNAISKLTHGAHQLVDTADNGTGPVLNPHPSTQGVENLCNPPGLGLGPRPTTDTGFAGVDAFLWTHVPGSSSGTCNGGPASGDFWAARAISEAERANGKLGPGYPSAPF
jgi:hypothetical protein